MENRNIYKMDDVLIVASFLMLIPAAYFSWPWLATIPGMKDFQSFFFSAPTLLGTRLNMVYMYLAGAVLAQLIGRIIRYKEKQTLEILDAMLFMQKTTLSQLAGNLNMPESKVKKLAKKLTTIPSLNLRLEGETLTMKQKEPSFNTMPTHTTSVPPVSPVPRKPEVKPVLNRDEEEAEEIFNSEIAPESSDPYANLPPKIKEFMAGNSAGLTGKMEILNKIATGAIDDSSDQQGSLQGSKKGGKGKIILMVFLMMTPLWPVALIVIVITVLKQYKKMKDLPAPAGTEEMNSEDSL